MLQRVAMVKKSHGLQWAGFLALCLISARHGSADDYSQWQYHRNFTIRTDTSGANITSDVYNFPLLIRLNPGNFGWINQAQSTGRDVRFTKSGGEHLPYQIERWNATNDTAEIWVRMDTVKAQSTSQYIVMYWGNGAGNVFDSSSGATVFDTATGFQGVWHFSEPTNNQALSATYNPYNGTGQGNPNPTDTACVIGKGKKFDGSSSYFAVGGTGAANSKINFPANGIFTVSAWANPSVIGSYGNIASKGDKDYALKLKGNNNTWDFFEYTTPTGWDEVQSPSALVTVNTWRHLVGVRNGTDVSLYVDGQNVGVRSAYNPNQARVTTFDLNIGRAPDAAQYFRGKIDELEISSTAREPDWIKLAYHTQRPDQATVCYPAAILTQPANQTVTLGVDTAKFSITARGTNPTYQWQRCPGGSSTWGLDARATSSTDFTFIPVAADTNSRYRCVVTSYASTDTSAAATLTICGVLKQPSDTSLYVGTVASFSTVAGGSGTSYQWQQNKNGAGWVSVANGTDATYAFTTDTSDTNDSFRCQLTGGGCSNATTRTAALTLCFLASISDQPDPTGLITAGNQATFSVTAIGKGITYQWQKLQYGNPTPADIPGATTPNYSLTTAMPATGADRAPDSGDQFRCVVTDKCNSKIATSYALLSVCAPPSISVEPGDLQSLIGIPDSMSVRAGGTGISYQWQRSDDSGASWNPLTVGTNTAAVWKFTVDSTDTGRKVMFRCQVSGTCGTVASSVARIETCVPLQITSHPKDIEVVSGQQAVFRVQAIGTNATYQWQYRNRGETDWSSIAAGATNSTYSFTTAAADSGKSFRCVVSITGNACAGSATSNPAILSICTPAGITTPPANLRITGGDTARFSVVASGVVTGYQWQRSINGTDWPDMTGATSALLKFKSDTADTESQYRCVVSGRCGNATSAAARLTLCYAPVITQQPADVRNAAVTQQATFTVRASGVRAISYQWQYSFNPNDANSWAPVPGANASSYAKLVTSGENNSFFRCRLTNSCDSVIYSGYAALSVCTPPAVLAQPANASVIEGQVAQFAVSASGTNRSCRWLRANPGSNAYDTVPGATDTFYTFTAQLSDTGRQFRCAVRSDCGACTSSVATLTVYKKAKASFSTAVGSRPDSIGPAPLQVSFNDASSGAISKWKWYWDDGHSDSSVTSANQVHKFDSARSYSVRLIVSGPGGIDSAVKTIVAYPIGGNQMLMAGRYLAPDAVELMLSNYSGLRTAAPLPYVSSIKLWNRTGGLPADTSGSKQVKTYDLSTLKAAGTQYRDTVKVARLSGADSVYGFMTQIVWNDGSMSKFLPVNGCEVLMRDTVKPANPLVISGGFSPRDTVFFYLDSVKRLDTAGTDSVLLWYGLGTDTVPDFTGGKKPAGWSTQELVRGASNGRYTWINKNDKFNTDRTSLRCAAIVVGRNKMKSRLSSATFAIGRTRPANPVVLHAAALNASTIRLRWDPLKPSDSVERIRIYYRKGGALPLEYDFSSLTVDSVAPQPKAADTAATVFRLTEKTRFYFSAQTYGRDMWSRVTQLSSSSDSTPEAATSTITNTVTVSKVTFDTATTLLHIYWRVDTAVGSSLQIGFSYSTSKTAPGDTAIATTMDVKNAVDSVTVNLGSSLRFDTTLYVHTWLKKNGEKWAAPTAASTGSVFIPPFVKQAVRYNFAYTPDTVYAAGRLVRLVIPPVQSQSQTATYNATIRQFTAPAASFIAVGQTIRFTDQTQSAAFDVGLQYRDLPSRFSWRDVRIYRYDGTNWLATTGAQYDTVHSYIFIRTNELFQAFAVMIDTAHPKVRFLNTRRDPLEKGASVSDTAVVSDNVGNVEWHFRCVRGQYPLSAGDTVGAKKLTNGLDTAALTIPGAIVSDESGVRAALIVSDGHYSDTFDLSRRVIRLHSDVVQSFEMKWLPLRVTATLDSSGVSRLWRQVDTSVSSPQYDPRYARLFRWYPDSGTKDVSGNGNYLEYSPGSASRDSAFAFKPGRLFWIKTRKQVTFDFGRGVTMSLRDTVTLPLNPKGWTDLAVPFRYGVCVGDVLAATRGGSSYADSLQFYNWHRDTTSGMYSCTPFFIEGLHGKGLDSLSAVMSHRDLTGYTVYNPLNRSILLRIPPVSSAMSTMRGTAVKKTGAAGEWSIRVVPRTGDGLPLSVVYCGCAAGSGGSVPGYYPKPPALGDCDVGVFDASSGVLYGHRIEGSMKDGGCSFLLAFRNRGRDPAKIVFRFDRLGTIAQTLRTALFNQTTGEAVETKDGELTVGVEGQSTEYRWLFAGDAAYLARRAHVLPMGVLAFERIYPNPLRSFIHLRYSVPFGRVASVSFSVLDIRGRLVWRTVVKERSVLSGRRDCVWNAVTNDGRPVGAGMYIVKMTAVDLKDRTIGTFQQRFTILP